MFADARVFLPANGGLPTMVSKPGLFRSKTSGNSICQWKGTNGGSAFRRSSQPGLVGGCFAVHDFAGEFSAAGFAVFGFGFLKERGDREIAEESY